MSQDYWQHFEGGGNKICHFKNYIVCFEPEINLHSESGKYLKNLKEEHNIKFTRVYDYDTSDDYLWLATDSGLYKINEFDSEKYLLRDEWAKGVAISNENQVYAGCELGLFLLTTDSFALINSTENVFQMEYSESLYAFNNSSSRISNGINKFMRLGEFNDWEYLSKEELDLNVNPPHIKLKNTANNNLVLNMQKNGVRILNNGKLLAHDGINNNDVKHFEYTAEETWLENSQDYAVLRVINGDTTTFYYEDQINMFVSSSNGTFYNDIMVFGNRFYGVNDEYLNSVNRDIEPIHSESNNIYSEPNLTRAKLDYYNFLFSSDIFDNNSGFAPTLRPVPGISGLDFLFLTRDKNNKPKGFTTVNHHYRGELMRGTRKTNQGIIRPYVVRVRQNQIEAHKENYQKPGYTVPYDIKHWPANLYTEYGESGEMAPYYDFNKNNYYDPQNGDYPIIIGTETTYMILNDNHGLNSSMGVEIHLAVYGFSENVNSLNQNMYVNVFVKNQSENNYENVQAAIKFNTECGNPYDNYAGSDSVNSIAYVYNMDEIDQPYLSTTKFGENPPFFGIKAINEKFSSIRYETAYNRNRPYFSRESLEMFLNGKTTDNELYRENGKHTMFSFNGDPYLETGNYPAKFPLSVEPEYGFNVWSSTTLGSKQNKAYNFVVGYNDDAPNGNYLSSYSTLIPQLNYAEEYLINEHDIPKEWEPRIKGKYTSINQQTNNEEYSTRLYPNPTNSYFKISSFNELKKVQLIDLSGRVIKQWNNPPKNMKFNTSKIKNGQYVVKCSYLNDEVTFKTQVLH